jgi:hypothetical protein
MVEIMNINEQAFPNEGFNGWGEPQKGMTLRDYFAAKAMQGIIAAWSHGVPPAKDVSEAAYEYADAMLKTRP